MQQIKLVCDHNAQLYGWIALLAIKSLVDKSGVKTHLQIQSPDTPTNPDILTMPEYISVSPEEWLWLLNIGLDEQRTMAAADGAFLLGWRFSGWNDNESTQFCGFAPLLAPLEGARGANLATRYRRSRYKLPTYSDLTMLSLNGQCVKNDSFRHPVTDPTNVTSTLEYGVQLKVKGLCESIEAVCCQNVVTEPKQNGGHNEEITISLSTESFEPFLDAMSNTSQAYDTPKLTSIFTLSEKSFCIARFGRTTKNTFCIPRNIVNAVLSAANNHQISSHTVALSLPATVLMAGDAGISTLRQYMSQISNMMPTEKGWFAETRKALLQNFQHIDESCQSVAMMPFYLTNTTSVMSQRLEDIMQCFVGCGTISETEYPLFDTAIVENILLAFGCLPNSESPLAHKLPDDKLENMINQICNKLAQVAPTLPSHKEYLAGYLAEYL